MWILSWINIILDSWMNTKTWFSEKTKGWSTVPSLRLPPALLQIVRTDLKELRDFDLEGAPYGYTPFCESRREMDGYRFWKSGYWASHLAGRKYHIRCANSRPLRQGSCIFHTYMFDVSLSCSRQCSVCGRPEEVQENSSRRSNTRTVPGTQPRPKQPLQPRPGLSAVYPTF